MMRADPVRAIIVSTMRISQKKSAIALLVLLVALPLGAQSDSSQPDVSLRQIRELRAQVTNNASHAEDFRARVIELCDVATGALESAQRNHSAAQASNSERSGIGREMEAIQQRLRQPERVAGIDLPSEATIYQAEDALARERSRLAAHRTAVTELQRRREDRAAARNDASQRHGLLDQEIELLNAELRLQAQSDAHPDLKKAVRLNLLARREAAQSEIEKLGALLDLLEERGALLPLEIDLAQRRVATSEESVHLLEQAAQTIRLEAAAAELGRVRTLSDSITKAAPEFAGIAAETVKIAEVLLGADGVTARSEKTSRDIATLQKNLVELNRIAELTQRKFEAFGNRGSIGRWWPTFPPDFPEPGSVAKKITYLDGEIPEVEHQLISYEQQRSESRTLARASLLKLQTTYGDELDPKLIAMVRELFQVRQDLLDDMIRFGARYSTQLSEQRTLAATFHRRLERAEKFLYAHVLWSRSVPKPIVPRLKDIADSIRWLASTDHLRSLNVVGAKLKGRGLVMMLILVLIILLRRPIKRRLSDLADQTMEPEQDSLRLTIETLFFTVVLAVPLPLAINGAADFAQRFGDSTFWISAAEALPIIAMTAAFLELTRQLFAPRGLAEAHFGWPTLATQTLHRGLRWTEAIGLPLLFVAVLLVFAGVRFDSTPDLQVYNNSLGRLAFIAAMTVLGLSILAILRPVRRSERGKRDVRVPWPRRFSEYAFPTAFLGAYPMVVIATLVPAMLAVFGFYISAVLLAYQMLRTLWLVLVLLIAGGLIYRWRVVNRQRTLTELEEGDEVAKRMKTVEESERQVGQLFRFTVIAVVTFGLFSIWSDALPMLQIFKRVQILPHIELLAATEEPASVFDTADQETAKADPPSAVITDPATPATQAQPPLTLWNLFKALIAAAFTFALVKNLPAVIEIILRRRTNLDGGARFAFSTLVRYTITIVGLILVFGLLGITWGRVQWLAAALTFGLGFGLQEIVANFVSGLILLIERPIRVGDVVTIGNLMGKVSEIQIRATTITLWDRSEMIVPNKEFITTKLVNWTLSDSKRRIEIPVRIAYGADIEQVKTILVKAANEHPSVLPEPAPHALLLAFGEDAMKIELRFVVDFGQGLATKDEVQMVIEQEFGKQGIKFALPQRQVRVVSEGGSDGQPAAGFGHGEPERTES